MAIQPIDLQTLFTQMEKVGKTLGAQREGYAIQQALQGAQMERKTEEHIQSVNKPQDTGEGVEKVNDRREQKHEQAKGEKKSLENNDVNAAEIESAVVIRDPTLGRTIDISL